MNKLSVIVDKIEDDIQYHNDVIETYEVYSGDWNFHLGWIDALSTYSWQLKEILKDDNQ